MFRASLVFCGADTGLKFEMSDKTIIMSKREFNPIDTSVKIIREGCRDDTVPKTVETRRHCEVN